MHETLDSQRPYIPFFLHQQTSQYLHEHRRNSTLTQDMICKELNCSSTTLTNFGNNKLIQIKYLLYNLGLLSLSSYLLIKTDVLKSTTY